LASILGSAPLDFGKLPASNHDVFEIWWMDQFYIGSTQCEAILAIPGLQYIPGGQQPKHVGIVLGMICVRFAKLVKLYQNLRVNHGMFSDPVTVGNKGF